MTLPAPDHPAVRAVAGQIRRDLGTGMTEEDCKLAARGAVAQILETGARLELGALIQAALALVRDEGQDQ